MFLRMLSVTLIALAMLAAPLTMREGAAMAAEPIAAAMHHGDVAQMSGHCDGQGDAGQDQSHKAMGGNCCVAACVAVVPPMAVGDLPAFHPLVRRPTSDARLLGTLAEIATPPPRLA